MKISSLAGAALGFLGAIFHIVWNAYAVLPIVIYILFSWTGKNLIVALGRGLSTWPSYILLLYLCWYFLYFEIDQQLFRDIYTIHPFERNIVEGISACCYVLAFAIAAGVFQKRHIPNLVVKFSITYVAIEFVQYVININANENPQLYAYVAYTIYPFIILDFFHQSKKPSTRLVMLHSGIIFVLLAFVFKTRVPALGMLVFQAGYLIYPWLRSKAFIYHLFASSYIVVLLALVVLYVLAADAGIVGNYDSYSADYFGKGVDGRSYIWPDLLLKILEKPWFGHCSNCATEYFENLSSSRNLSSHNTFLEIAFRGGVFSLVMILILLYSFFFRFLNAPIDSGDARLGFSYLLSAILFMDSNEFGFTQTFTANLLFWCILGVLYSRSGPENAQSMFAKERN